MRWQKKNKNANRRLCFVLFCYYYYYYLYREEDCCQLHIQCTHFNAVLWNLASSICWLFVSGINFDLPYDPTPPPCCRCCCCGVIRVFFLRPFYSAHFQIFQADKFVSFALSLHTHASGTQRALPCARSLSLSQATLSLCECVKQYQPRSLTACSPALSCAYSPRCCSFARPLGRSHTDTFGLL